MGFREEPSEGWQGGNARSQQRGSPKKGLKKASSAHHKALRRLRARSAADLAGLRTDLQHLQVLFCEAEGTTGRLSLLYAVVKKGILRCYDPVT